MDLLSLQKAIGNINATTVPECKDAAAALISQAIAEEQAAGDELIDRIGKQTAQLAAIAMEFLAAFKRLDGATMISTNVLNLAPPPPKG
jgi:hypothetical protein